jgi:hypothetical protein
MNNNNPDQEKQFGDFIRGGIGSLFVNILLLMLFSASVTSTPSLWGIVGTIAVAVIVIGEIIGIIVGALANEKRSFFFLGALLGALLLLLIFGGCIWLIGSQIST